MEKFDEIVYWKVRHEKMRGDIRSVTKLNSNLEDSIKASHAFVRLVGELA